MRHDGSARILVVADDPGLQRLVARLLQHAGYPDVMCRDGTDRGLRDADPPFDLVVINSYIPDRSGDVALARARAAYFPAPVLHVGEVVGVDRFLRAVREVMAGGALEAGMPG